MPGSMEVFPVSKEIMFNFVKWVGKSYYYFDPISLVWTNLLDDKDTLAENELFEKFIESET